MTLMALLIFAGALAADSISPGPTVSALVARVLSQGVRNVLPFLIAIWLGEAIWLSVALAGLAALAVSFQLLFEIIKWAGVIYLFYLGWALFTSKPIIGDTKLPMKGEGITAFLSGLSISIGNPKNMLFYLTLMPSLIDMQSVTAMGWLQLVATLLVALAAVDLCWVFLAAKARTFFQNSRAIRRVNQVSGAAMALAAAAIATR
ncbi:MULTISPECIES: LysE family translocator [Alphaproteobacteria]|uniref:Lysine transporter LysE n=2 Tax=Alphaproteobacteria TaxID=28211 RepID=A0A512HI84_9HYPH|nr:MULTISPECIES: LysE family translocator [Alphaproteobacteria]GEO85158.1 lysine transporter LysE [Ciceribacter naphthalenivorans]GLR24508.1 lysine transporter LysE [Ciceribacter naphthalenivorans]GLT07364.1 lysine transporter LysE [Sphingomonas psychrolutea]